MGPSLFRGPRLLRHRRWWLQVKVSALELAWRTWAGTFLGTLAEEKLCELQRELKLLLLLQLTKRRLREVNLLQQLPQAL